MVIALLLGCIPPAVDASPRSLLVRASMDLRGIRPSPAELAEAEADPAQVDGLIERWLQDERLGERVVDLWAPIYGTRSTESDYATADYGIDDERAFVAALGEEPLRILGMLAVEDRPYPEIVTADWTVIDERLAWVYPASWPEGQTGWHRVYPEDHRPAAGILASAGLWWRYQTTDTNANRGRANALSRILVCNDYLERPVEFTGDVDLLDDAAIREAIANDPGCTSCHVSMDPIGSALWGWAQRQLWNPEDLTDYDPEYETRWVETTGVPPAWYGRPVDGLEALGAAIADDPRLVQCFTEQATSLLLQRPVGVETDAELLLQHREAFLDGGVTIRALFRSILATDEYRAGSESFAAPRKVVTPHQLASSVEALTGYRLTVDGHDAIGEDIWGLRSLAGADANQAASDPGAIPSPTLTLVQERLAEAAGLYVAAADAADPAHARLLTRVRFTETPTTDRATMAAQAQDLYLAVLSQSVEADGPEVAALLTLWEEVYAAEGDPVVAWGALVAALLGHPDFLVYG